MNLVDLNKRQLLNVLSNLNVNLYIMDVDVAVTSVVEHHISNISKVFRSFDININTDMPYDIINFDQNNESETIEDIINYSNDKIQDQIDFLEAEKNRFSVKQDILHEFENKIKSMGLIELLEQAIENEQTKSY